MGAETKSVSPFKLHVMVSGFTPDGMVNFLQNWRLLKLFSSLISCFPSMITIFSEILTSISSGL